MLLFINSSKSLNFDEFELNIDNSVPFYINQADQLAEKVKNMGYRKMKDSMKISDKLAHLNYQRFLEYHSDNIKYGKPAAFFYSGHVYQGFEVSKLNKEDMEYAQRHLRIISGLYGILKPLDLIQPYRMEMDYKIYPSGKKILKDYWKSKVKKHVLEDVKENKNILINLSSKEYSQILEPVRSEVKWIDIHFKDTVNGRYQFVTLYGKKARGMMASYLIQNRINDIEGIKNFDIQGYYYSEEKSDGFNLVFLRDQM